MFNLIAVFSGLLFGIGMALSGMINPENVIGFLDIAGAWNPSLIFVMGGALLVFMPTYFVLVKGMSAPICSKDFKMPVRKKIDTPLLVGATLFGIGWGMVGICPGPAVTSLATFNTDALLFIVAIFLGMALAGKHRKACGQLS